MKKIRFRHDCKKLLSDIYTPVGIYLRLRDRFRDTDPAGEHRLSRRGEQLSPLSGSMRSPVSRSPNTQQYRIQTCPVSRRSGRRLRIWPIRRVFFGNSCSASRSCPVDGEAGAAAAGIVRVYDLRCRTVLRYDPVQKSDGRRSES